MGPALLLEPDPRPLLVASPMAVLGLAAWVTAPRSVRPPNAAEKRRLEEAVAQLVAGGPLRFQTSSAFALNLGLGFAALVLPGVVFWSRARSYAAVLDGEGALTRAGQRHRWADLARVSTREFRSHRRGWYIGQRLVELDFTTGHVLLEEVALDGPFQAVWDGFHAR